MVPERLEESRGTSTKRYRRTLSNPKGPQDFLRDIYGSIRTSRNHDGPQAVLKAILGAEGP